MIPAKVKGPYTRIKPLKPLALASGYGHYSGYHFDPQLASRDDFWLTMAAISLKKGGGGPIFVPTNPHGPTGRSQNLKILILSGVTAISGL
jgi:hypothetical protein